VGSNEGERGCGGKIDVERGEEAERERVREIIMVNCNK
jgi:hypothetical protein